MIHLVTFADDVMSVSRQVCDASARSNGVESSWPWDLPMLQDTAFYRHNKALLDMSRGRGFWAWKPYIILRAISDDICKDGDTLIYSDAGVEFINNVSHIIDRMDQDIFLFGNNWEHAHWCKRDIVDEIWSMSSEVFNRIVEVDKTVERDDTWDKRDALVALHQMLHVYPDTQWKRFGKQVQASVIFFRVSDYTRKFVKEWLDWCLFEGGRLIDDSPSRTPNHPEFQENRHDQAILTTMAYRDGLKLHWWPAIYNDGQFTYEKLPVYANDDYPPIFHHHRRRNHEWASAA